MCEMPIVSAGDAVGVVADREVELALRARHEQQRIVAAVARSSASDGTRMPIVPTLSCLMKRRADAEAHRRPTSPGGGRRDRAWSPRCPSRGRRAGSGMPSNCVGRRASANVLRAASMRQAVRRARRSSARAAAARTARGSLAYGTPSGRVPVRVVGSLVGVEAGDDAEAHAAAVELRRSRPGRCAPPSRPSVPGETPASSLPTSIMPAMPSGFGRKLWIEVVDRPASAAGSTNWPTNASSDVDDRGCDVGDDAAAANVEVRAGTG